MEITPKPSRRVIKKHGSTRERTGCLTCRQRRKKCLINTYPICGDCQRLNLECVREDPRPFSRDINDSNEDRRDNSILSSKVQDRLSTREAPRYQITDSIKIPSVIRLASFMDSSEGSEIQRFLKYYTHVLAELLTTNHENNSFLSVFLPLAVESRPFLDALVAWSSAHLSSLQPNFLNTALTRQSKAIQSLSNSLSVQQTDHTGLEVILATSLVLCATEIALGHSQQWYDHLVGARQIILHARSYLPRLDGVEVFKRRVYGIWLLRNFAYHDVLASVTMNQKPLIPGTYWLEDNNHSLDAYMGYGSELLAFISNISELGRSPEPEPLYPAISVGESQANHEYDHLKIDMLFLEQKIREWSCPVSIRTELEALAEAWRSAALIYLYRKMRTYSKKNTRDKDVRHSTESIENKIDIQVIKIMQYLDTIPLMSLPECGLLFPIFIAGGETTDRGYIDKIRGRLKLLEECRGFANIPKARHVLEHLWRMKIESNQEDAVPDWLDVLEQTGEKLILV